MELQNNQEVVQVQEETREMGVLSRFVNIIFEPGKVFRGIVEKPKILAPIITVILALLILTVPTMKAFENYAIDSNEKMYKNEKYLKTQNISKENADKVIDAVSKYAKYGTFAVPVKDIFKLLIGAAVLFGIMRLLEGVGTFKQTIAVVWYAAILDILGQLVKMVTILLSGNYEVSNSPAIFMTNDKTSFFYDLIFNLDLFTIWFLAVAALGLSIIHKVSAKKAYVTVFAGWAVYILIITITTYKSAIQMYDKFGITL